MARPFKCRRVHFKPGVTYFKPAGVPLRDLCEVRLSLDEAEALRLRELECLDQTEASKRMNVSRATFQRILASARRKTADALLNGKAIRIEGGHSIVQAGEGEGQGSLDIALGPAGGSKLKIAVVSDDGKTISQHFGYARQYVVVTVENGTVTGREVRPKTGHAGAQEHPVHDSPTGRHGYDAASQARHGQMLANITDCQLLIAGGMGWGARDSLKAAGIETIVTDAKEIDEAVRLYLEGKLKNLSERLH